MSSAWSAVVEILNYRNNKMHHVLAVFVRAMKTAAREQLRKKDVISA